MTLCSDCWQEKSADRRHLGCCSSCAAKRSKRNKRYMAALTPAQRARRASRLKAESLRRLYGLTVEEHDAMKEQQQGRCASCGDLSERLVVDHNHSTGQVRKLLCVRCNIALGHLLENPVRIAQLRQYIMQFEKDTL